MATTFSKAIRVMFVSLIYVAAYELMQVAVEVAAGFLGIYRQLPAGRGLMYRYDEIILSNLFLCSAIAMVLSLFLFWAMGILRERKLKDELKFENLSNTPALPAVLIAFGCRLGVSVYAVIADQVDVLRESVENSVDTSSYIVSPGKLTVYLVVTIILAPVFEEILFRGIVQTELLRGFPVPMAIFVGALFFSAAHGMLYQSLFTFFVGLLLGWSYYVTRNLFTSILIHMVFNGTTLITEVTILSGTLWLTAASVAAIALVVAGCLWMRARCPKINNGWT